MNKIYALYKGDEFIAVGTLKEISIMTGISYSNVRHINSNSKKGIVGRKGFLLVEIEYELEELEGKNEENRYCG